jgi:adenylate kinase
MSRDILLFGAPGAGKGTQAHAIAEATGLPHIATGDMFRALDTSTELGRQVKAIMDAGDLVPDEVTVAMIEERLSQPDATGGFVLDGFPRNLAQADALDGMLTSIGKGLDAILFFDVPDSVGMQRALSRAELEGRSDDTPEVIQRRLDTYHRETKPIVEHYRTTGKLIPIHADRSIEDVWAEISDALEQVPA